MNPLLESAIERAVGRSIEEIKATPLSELKRDHEARTGRPIAVTGDLLTPEQVSKALDEALR